MSFFRVLLALLISGGIAYGLYRAVDGKGVERVVEAVRAEIETPNGAGESADADSAEAPETPETAETTEAAEAEPVAPAASGDDAAALAEGTESADADAEPAADAPAEPVAETQDGSESGTEEGANFTERTEAKIADAMQQGIAPTEQPAPEETVQAEAPVENDVPRILPLPSPPDAILPDDVQAPTALEDQTALPAARIAAEDSTDRTDVLSAVSNGMTYAEARATLIDAGWIPRIPTAAIAEPDANESALIEAGYIELEGCKGDERPFCRFEFIDDDNRIAAILTAGAGTDPSVIDAFLMNTRTE